MADPKPGLTTIENKLWFAGSISERKAEQLLNKLREPGVFLVRASLLPEVDYVLTVSSGTEIWHYDIKILPSDECILNNYKFTDLPSAIDFYTENRLGSVFLTEPESPIVSKSDIAKAAVPAVKVAPVLAPPRTSSLIKVPEPKKEETESSESSEQANEFTPKSPTHRLSQSPLNTERMASIPSPSPNAKQEDNVQHFVLSTSATDSSGNSQMPTSGNATQNDETPNTSLEMVETSFDSDEMSPNVDVAAAPTTAAGSDSLSSSLKTPDTKPIPSPASSELPPVPKRTTSEVKTELQNLPGIKQRQLELEKKMKGEEDEVQPVTPTAPKRLAIPETFNDPPPPVKSPTATTPKRLSIPTTLQAMPPPPPLATHPGLAKKKEDEEKVQLLEQQQRENEKKKAESKKKQFGLLKRATKKGKKGSSTSEESVKAEPIAETLSSPPESKQSRRLSAGILIPISPITKEGGAELENAFKHITKHGWNSDELQPSSTAFSASTSSTTMALTTLSTSSAPSASSNPSPTSISDIINSPSSMSTSTARATTVPKTTAGKGPGSSSALLSVPFSPAIAETNVTVFQQIPLPSSFAVNAGVNSSPTKSESEEQMQVSPVVEPSEPTQHNAATTSVDAAPETKMTSLNSAPIYPISTFTSAASASKPSNSPSLNANASKPSIGVSTMPVAGKDDAVKPRMTSPSLNANASKPSIGFSTMPVAGKDDAVKPRMTSSSFSMSTRNNGSSLIPVVTPTISALTRAHTITVRTQQGPVAVPLRSSRPSASPNTRRSTTSFYEVVRGVKKAESTPPGSQQSFSRYVSSPSIGVANQRRISGVFEEEPTQPGVAYIGPMNTKRRSMKRKGKK